MSRGTKQRRMAMSRQMLQRRPGYPPLVRPLPSPPPAPERPLNYLDESIRKAQQDVAQKRLDLQASWTRLQALESEKKQILVEPTAHPNKEGSMTTRSTDEAQRFDVVD
jgi:hypothetical protein